ncbi:predicted transcriptional regulators [Streptococcus intermedius]|uniref:Helix-turn-helix transcriptional regulator n=1 Tax=Streptococcus intermedius TaxID=1338 RepID=A0A930RDV8_STRIT|nr:helix-turn-helix domain-containing protein [Streptococcus intermedius]MBF1713414.1 helix-turn-helix transcriptional regulator [Streptococcus intermedius]BAW17812.1 predicted transcriptional regulators [Streptococcus intermedius]
MVNNICPVKLTLSLISNKWKVLIIHELLSGKKRYGQLERSLNPITKKVLSENLHELEESSLIGRKVYCGKPIKVEYYLTDLGLSLKPILYALRDWEDTYKKVNNK